jgi:hypothetical protein
MHIAGQQDDIGMALLCFMLHYAWLGNRITPGQSPLALGTQRPKRARSLYLFLKKKRNNDPPCPSGESDFATDIRSVLTGGGSHAQEMRDL